MLMVMLLLKIKLIIITYIQITSHTKKIVKKYLVKEKLKVKLAQDLF